jgi:hypothetical protein
MKNLHFERRTIWKKQYLKTRKLSSLSTAELVAKITYELMLINISRDFPEGD